MERRKYDVSDIMFAILTESKKKCKHCGHTMLLGNSEKKICTNCGFYVFRNSKIEFKYKLQAQMKKH